MPKYVTNQPYGKNATTNTIENSLRLTQSRRSGDWGRVAPESTAGYKATQGRMKMRQNLASGQYFPNNVVEKQTVANKRSVESFMTRKQSIDNRQ